MDRRYDRCRLLARDMPLHKSSQSNCPVLTALEHDLDRAAAFERDALGVKTETGSSSLKLKSPRWRTLSAGDRNFHSTERLDFRAKSPGVRSSSRLSEGLDFERDSGVWLSDSTLFKDCTLDLDEVPVRDRGDKMYYGSQVQLQNAGLAGGSNATLKLSSYPQDSLLSVFPDNDSGFSSTLRSRSRSGLLQMDDFNSMSPSMNRSQSMTRLNLSNVSQENELPMSPRYRPFDHSLRRLKDNLDDSENRRVVLVHKLKEAQGTLELQGDRLNKIEGSAKTNTILVEDLKIKESQYRNRIHHLERNVDERDTLKMENLRLREEMQSRIDKLDFQLRSLQAQHQVSEQENGKRSGLLEHTTLAMTLLENENNKLQKDKELLRHEILVAKEAMKLARNKFGPMEEENNSLRDQLTRNKDENNRLSTRAKEVTEQLSDVRKLTDTMKEENEKLASSWKTLSEEKQKLNRQLEGSQDGQRETRTRVSALSTERDRLFQEKVEMNSKVQQLMTDKDQIEKTKIALEEQLAEQEEELGRSKKGTKRREEDKRRMEDEYIQMRKNCDGLGKELASTKAYYERSLEQISVLENNKQLAVQQQELAEQEKHRLQMEVERLREIADGKTKDLRRGREQLEEAVLDLKGELRQSRHDKSKLEDKVQEMDIKLQKANESVHESAHIKQGEIDMLKSTVDRLSSGASKKETELQNMTDKIQDMELQNERLKEELRSYKEECQLLQEHDDDIKKVKEENRKLMQENAENDQVIKLLETQKEVLTQSIECNHSKLGDLDKLSDQIEQYRNENELLRDRINELEKVRDNLIRQKEAVLANTELIYKKPQKELEEKIEEIRQANKQLREINEQINEKAEMLSQENATLKDAIGGDGSVVPRVEMERMSREKERLQSDFDHMKQEYENLEERHQRFIINYGHDGSEAQKDKENIAILEREKDSLEKQVALINGQMLLVEGGKKRLDDVVDDLQVEIVQLRQQLEEAEKRIQEFESSAVDKGERHAGGDQDVMQEEISALTESLNEANYEKEKQKRLINALKEESLDDVGTELHEMRDELQKLMGVIESKDHAIETLENQLRTSKDEIHCRERAVSDLRSIVSDLEAKNDQLVKSVDHDEISSSAGASSLSGPRMSRSPVMRASRIPRKLDGDGKSEEQIKRSQSEKGGDRLQSLITKYRSYSDTGNQVPERKIKPLSVSPSTKMGLVTKGRSFGPSAPKGDKVSFGDGVHVATPSEQADSEHIDGHLPQEVLASETNGKTAAPENILSSINCKHSPMSSGEAGADITLGTEGETGTDDDDDDDDDDISLDENGEQRDINALIDSCYRTHLAFLKKLKKRGGKTRTFRGGLLLDAERLGKLYEQQLSYFVRYKIMRAEEDKFTRASLPQPILSVSPPKITSKVIADLLKTSPTTASYPPPASTALANVTTTTNSTNGTTSVSADTFPSLTLPFSV